MNEKELKEEEELKEKVSEKLIASGGLIAPVGAPYLARFFAVVTMRPFRRRIRAWFNGEPTFTIEIYDREEIPSLHEIIPQYTATLGRVEYEG